MFKTHTYLAQIIGIIVLVCSYLLSDQPDSLSLMHFDPSAPSVITKLPKSTPNSACIQMDNTSPVSGRHKTNVPKFISYDLMLPHTCGYHFESLMEVNYTALLPETYSYLFYEEINPPPPRLS
jgi:hypothetical protein